MNFYGPHESKSKVASYPCFSLLRSYKMEQEYGDIYIYLESGYKYLQKLIPGSVMGMDTVFLIESEEGRTMYCSDSRLVPLYSDLDSYRKELEEKIISIKPTSGQRKAAGKSISGFLSGNITGRFTGWHSI